VSTAKQQQDNAQSAQWQRLILLNAVNVMKQRI